MQSIRHPLASPSRIDPRDAQIEIAGSAVTAHRSGASRRRPLFSQPVVPARNPFEILGGPYSPMRVICAPLEVALYLPAYAVDLFHGHRTTRR